MRRQSQNNHIQKLNPLMPILSEQKSDKSYEMLTFSLFSSVTNLKQASFQVTYPSNNSELNQNLCASIH